MGQGLEELALVTLGRMDWQVRDDLTSFRRAVRFRSCLEDLLAYIRYQFRDQTDITLLLTSSSDVNFSA